ncbi:MAG: hypothetical protein CL785_03005 [Chloroflexi bacterium]|nr:hypothetical protein [Chloroflexota bacterium]|tara:strand:+ start:12926 stop:13930 length:1005 start_codon:yes stop_codon:yes gene_type:complete
MKESENEIARVAVIGTGSAGMQHLNALSKLPNVYPIAIPKRVSRLNDLKNANYAAVSSLSEAAEIGANKCIIASDTKDHWKDCLEAFDHGLDVLVEKPMTVSTTEANDLNKACQKLNTRLYIGCLLRFSESLQIFANQVPNIGPLHSVLIESRSYLPDWRPNRAYRESYSARSGEGGVLLDMIHEIDYATWIFGFPSSVQCKTKNLGRLGIQSEEIAELSLEIDSGCLISINLDYITKEPIRWVRALGTNGRLDWNGITGEVTQYITNNTAQKYQSKQTPMDLFVEQAKAFVQSNQYFTHPNLVSGYEGALSLEICEAAVRSSRNRKTEVMTQE